MDRNHEAFLLLSRHSRDEGGDSSNESERSSWSNHGVSSSWERLDWAGEEVRRFLWIFIGPFLALPRRNGSIAVKCGDSVGLEFNKSLSGSVSRSPCAARTFADATAPSNRHPH